MIIVFCEEEKLVECRKNAAAGAVAVLGEVSCCAAASNDDFLFFFIVIIRRFEMKGMMCDCNTCDLQRKYVNFF